MEKAFGMLERPLVVGSIRQAVPEAVIKDIKASEADGAKAFILHIQLMEEQYRNFETFKKIAASTDCPVMAIYYRDESKLSDEQRLNIQFEAVHAGFCSVDLRADTFDNDSRSSLINCQAVFASANPKEITMCQTAIEKQKETIERFHKNGAEVLMSAHVYVELSDEQTVALALEMESRSADIVKIITDCQSPEHALHMLDTITKLKKYLKVPFVYSCYGPHGSLLRPVAPLFGSMLVFGHHEYTELSNREKPLIRDIKELYRIIKWSI